MARRINRMWLLVLSSVLLLAPIGSNAAPVKLNVGIPAYYEGFLPLYTAIGEGFFKDEGLDINVVLFKGGGAAGQAFISGAVDLCLCSFDHVIKMQAKGFDAVAIGGIEEYNAYALIAKKGAIPPGVKSLAGKKIGITTPGSSTDILLRYELKRAGVDVKRVSLISIGGASAMRAALEHDQIDAGMVIGGILVEMLHKGGWEIVEDFRTHRYPLEVTIAKRSWLNANADTARKFLSAMVRAERLLQTNMDVAYKYTGSMFKTMDGAVMKGVAEAAVHRLSPDGTINKEGAEEIVNQQVFADVIAKPVPYDDLVDLSYLREAAHK